MTKTNRPLTKASLEQFTKLLSKARARYEDKLLAIEKIWANLKPNEYEKRKMITDLTKDLLEIDKSLKVWESKVKN